MKLVKPNLVPADGEPVLCKLESSLTKQWFYAVMHREDGMWQICGLHIDAFDCGMKSFHEDEFTVVEWAYIQEEQQ